MKINFNKFFLIAGPCIIENEKICFKIANELKKIKNKFKIQVIYKASYLKANRSSINSYQGPGLEKGLKVLEKIKQTFHLPILTDVHESNEINEVAKIADIIQIPAFLCRQTKLLITAGKTKCLLNIKKGQFLAPWDMENVINKIKSVSNNKILITERGSCFGYNNLVVDYRGMIYLLKQGYPVVFDATHSVQLPSSKGNQSGGDRTLAAPLAFAAASIGVKGFFFETHPNPDKALCDGPNSVYLKELPNIVNYLLKYSVISQKNKLIN